MNFKIKVGVHWLIHVLPFSLAFHRVFQKHISKELWSHEHLESKLEIANTYLETYQKFRNERPKNALDFGAGFDVIIPLYLSQKGIGHHIYDNENKLIPELVIKRANEIFKPQKVQFTSVQEILEANRIIQVSSSFQELVHSSIQFDVIHSTVVFEYLSEEEIEKTLQGFKKLLNPKGLVMLTINYRDHWSHADAGISDYNFLRYSKQEWKRFCPPTCGQNRMRHSDYLACITSAGFKVLTEETVSGQISELRGKTIHQDFKDYAIEDLLVKESFLVLGN
jgi:SAM-dependent methyltransferase